jgi:uncharacterized damage-inducible protein DinB
MSEVAPWLDRKFTFAFPVDIYPELIVRLGSTPGRVEAMTVDVPREQLTRKPGGKWSMQENAGHLVDLEALWLTRLDEFLKGADRLTAADLRNTKTQEAQHNERRLEEILSEFRKARQTLLERLDGLRREQFACMAHHPRLNTAIRLVDHLCFIAEHDDHHLARIWELRRAVSE